MKTKKEIVRNWLFRYTGVPLEEFGDYILLTNFLNYVKRFALKQDRWEERRVGEAGCGEGGG